MVTVLLANLCQYAGKMQADVTIDQGKGGR